MRRSLLMVGLFVLFAVGLFIVFRSVPLGSEAASAYLRAQGGGMDGSQFMVVFQESITMYRWLGGILSVLGGFGFVKAVEIR